MLVGARDKEIASGRNLLQFLLECVVDNGAERTPETAFLNENIRLFKLPIQKLWPPDVKSPKLYSVR
ncbi:hypothetical protein AgCh_027078 [Apium graveolens]